MKKSSKTKLCSGILSAAMLLSAATPMTAYAEPQHDASASVVDAFKNPSDAAKPMFRAWFDNAGYDYTILDNEIKDMYDKGFGGIEVAVIPNYNYEDDYYAWGREGWTNMLKQLYKSAADLSGDFRIDITISPYWPVATDDIDPNDEAASTELVYAYAKIQDTDTTMDLPMPAIDLLCDGKNAVVPFVHTNRFEAATIAKVAEVKEDGTIVLDTDSMKDVSTVVSQKEETTPAGVPDFDSDYVNGLYEALFADENHGGYTDCTVDGMDKLLLNYWGDRELMQDTQYYYEVSTADLGLEGYTASEGDELQAGDYVLYGFYRKGTGETHNKSYDEMSPFGIHVSNTTPEGCVVINEFNKAGADAITGYWDEHILDDELTALIKENPGDIFEDSLEAVSTTPFWTDEFLTLAEDDLGYDMTSYLPLIACKKGSAVTFTSDENIEDAVYNDYLNELGTLYSEDHLQRISDWAEDTLDCGFRVQSYGNECIDSGYTAYILDTAEGETLAFTSRSKPNCFREISAGVHMSGKNIISDECLAIQLHPYQLSWTDYVECINKDLALGVNRIILHGYCFSKEDPTGASSQWPGYSTMGTFYSEPNGPRHTYWEDVSTYSGYVSRTQAVLQSGTIDTDVAVFETDTFTGTSPELTTLLNKGYSYEVLSEGLLTMDELQVRSGKLTAGDASYSAVIVYDESELTIAAAKKLYKIASKGVPVIFYLQTPAELTDSMLVSDEDNAAFAKLMDKLLAQKNVVEAADDAALLTALTENNAVSAVTADQAGLETQHRTDADGTEYYYLFNNSDAAVSFDVTLEGRGIPYQLDAWTGDIKSITDYTSAKGSVTLNVSLAAYEATIIAVTEDEKNFPAPETTIKTVAEDAETTALDTWNISLESWGPYSKEETVNSVIAKKTTIEFPNQTLVTWNNLEATEEQLAELGVESMANVSGIATYTTTFTLPETWTEEDGLYLDYTHNAGTDEITRVVINGNTISNINAMRTRVDIGDYLKAGENTISIRVCSTIVNRYAYENFHNGNNWAMTIHGFFGLHLAPDTAESGLQSVTLVPYKVTAIDTETETEKELKVVKAALEKALFAVKKAHLCKVVSLKKGTLTLKFNALKGADGYQILLANKKSLKSFKAVTTTKTLKTVTGLTRGKRYYAAVRAFAKLGDKKVYTAISNIKSAVVK